MLCNNEQFSSATMILNVFIVNVIWYQTECLTDAWSEKERERKTSVHSSEVD